MPKFNVGDRVLHTIDNRSGVIVEVLTRWTYFKNGKQMVKNMIVYCVKFDGQFSSTSSFAIAQKTNHLKKIKKGA
jgi:hypothetical protein